MPRTLPWLQNKPSARQSTLSTARTSSSRNPSTLPPSPKRRRLSPSADSDNDLPTGVSTPDRRRALRPARTPSTSPPPAPPDQQLMRDGYDDTWMMVEDEFHTTAKLYTSHLHHAEYQRLKKLASEREAKAILRPVDPRAKLSIEAHRELQREEKDKITAKATKKALGEDDVEDDDPWVGTQLAGLMESPKKSERLMVARTGNGRSSAQDAARPAKTELRQNDVRDKSPSRAARQEPRKEKQILRQEKSDHSTDDEDEDDLDAPIRTAKSFDIPSKSIRPSERPSQSFASIARDPSPSRRREKPRSPQLHRRDPQSPESRERTTATTPSVRSLTSKYTATRKDMSSTSEALDRPAARSFASKYTTGSKDTNSRLSEQARPVSTVISRQRSPIKSELDDLGGFPAPKQSPKILGGSNIMARRRELQARKAKDQEKKESNVIAEVPTFLI